MHILRMPVHKLVNWLITTTMIFYDDDGDDDEDY